MKGQNEQQVAFTGKELTKDDFIFETTDLKKLSLCGRKNQGVLMSGKEYLKSNLFFTASKYAEAVPRCPDTLVTTILMKGD